MTQTTNAAPASPLAQLAHAEAVLVAQVLAAADRLDAIGTSALGDALARLQASADAARDRLASAAARVQWAAGEVLDHVSALAEQLAEQLASGAAVEPAPVQSATVKAVEPVVVAEAPALPAPSSTSMTCSVCGFAPRKGATVCCGVAIPAPTAPPVIDLNRSTMADVLGAIVAPHPSDTTRTVSAEDLAGQVPAGAPASKPRSRKGKAAANGLA